MPETSAPKVLVIEDDVNVSRLVSLELKDHGFEAEVVANGSQGYQRAQGGNYDLLIVDIMLPGMDGLEICKRLREGKKFLPILILTARGTEIDRILGLEIGADDYLIKPFSIRELIARVKALCRRSRDWNLEDGLASEDDDIRVGELHIERQKRRVHLSEKEIDLTAKEYELLLLLAASPGRVYSRDQILSLVWDYSSSSYEHTVTSHINRLRSKLETDPSKPRYLLTEWGVGYRFTDKW